MSVRPPKAFRPAANRHDYSPEKTRTSRVVLLGPNDDAIRHSLVAVIIWASYLHRLAPDSVYRALSCVLRRLTSPPLCLMERQQGARGRRQDDRMLCAGEMPKRGSGI